MSDNDFRSELEMWCDLWDDAQKENIHPSTPKPTKSKDTGFSGDTTQDSYYDYLDLESEYEVLQEEKIPNPVYPDSVGPDYARPPEWVTEDLLKEVESLKSKLFDVENKVAKLGSGKKLSEQPLSQMDPVDSNLMSQIESLRKKIEKVSNHIGLKDEPSPWKTERD
jgi:hypothetical protein